LDPFQLTEEAVLDVHAIWLYLLDREGLDTADRIVTYVFIPLHTLADIPASGHRRADFTNRPVLFYRIYSYLIVYVPETKPLKILGVLHGKRNVARILRQRL